MLPPPAAVFFDMDDTLLDSSGGVEAAWHAVSLAMAPELAGRWPAVHAAFRREAGVFWRDEAAVGHWRVRLHAAREHVMRLALIAEGLDPALAAPLSDRYAAEVEDRWRLFDDALVTLDTLRGRGIRLALLTNGPSDMQQRKVARFDLARHFDAVVIEGVFGRGKPDREVFEHALAATDARPNEAWHVGDNLYADVGGAKNAGLGAIWIHRERLTMKDDYVVPPDLTIAHLAELIALLD